MTGNDAVLRGNALLAEGKWEEAKRLFIQSLAVGEDAEALAGLAAASRWLDDIDGAISASERSYLAFVERRAGDRAAEAAVALAELFLDYRGEEAVASGWLQRARHWLSDDPDHPALVFIAGLEAYLALAYHKNPIEARRLAENALDLAGRLGEQDVQVMATAQLGLVRVSQGEIREGMRQLDDATAAAVAGEIGRHEAVETFCFLITACERVRDFDRVAQWSRRVLELAEEMGSGSFASFARTQYANVLIWSGDWARAEAELSQVVEDNSNRPLTAAMGLLHLSSLRRRQGRLDEAEDLLRRAEREPFRRGVRHLVMTARASFDLENGQPQAAADMAERYLRVVSEDDPLERIEALEILVRARAGLSDPAAAMRGARELAEIASVVSTDAVKGAARAAYGFASRAAGVLDEARSALEQAIAFFGSSGVPHEELRARLELAETQVELGDPEAAGREAAAARQAADHLGAAADVARADRLLSTLRSSRDGHENLTGREVEVLRLLGRGRSNADIADELFLSVRTVERHISNIYAKIGVFGRSARAAAAAYAQRHGIT